ncbi:MAG: cytochrome c [Steroidobacteraceae bacterium]
MRSSIVTCAIRGRWYMRESVRVITLIGLMAIGAESSPGLALDLQAADQVARGHYLAIAGDCAACHTAPDGKPFAGGLAIETPFGTLLSANITPDRQAGIGAWSDDDFVRSMQQGIAPGGMHLYPAMPYPSFTHVTREDLLAVRAYLSTLDAVSDPVVTNRLPFPFDIRASVLVWNALNFSAGEFRNDASRSAEWNRGAYLVSGLGHCGTCHTPKNLLGGDKSGAPLSGAAVVGWYAPPLDNNARTGLGAWRIEDIVAYLKTGWGAGQAATGTMALVVADSTSQLSDSDLHSIAVYLKDIAAPAQVPAPLDKATPIMRSGKALYLANCSACHTSSGEGVAGLAPTLASSPIVQAASTDTLIDVVLNGAQAVATDAAPTAPGMPAFGWQLSDEQIAALLTYIRNDWGNAGSTVAASDVHSTRGRHAD